jgi:hypothetical protein
MDRPSFLLIMADHHRADHLGSRMSILAVSEISRP